MCRRLLLPLTLLVIAAVSQPAEARMRLSAKVIEVRQRGMKVTQVSPGGIGARMGIRTDDVILSIDGNRTLNYKTLMKCLDRALNDGPAEVVWQRGERYYRSIAQEVGTAPINEPPRTFLDVERAQEVIPRPRDDGSTEWVPATDPQ